MPEEKKLNETFSEKLQKNKEVSKDGDVLGKAVWALILIWAGIVFLAVNLGWIDRYGLNINTSWKFQSYRDWNSFGVWNLVALGAGGIFFIETIIRLLVPKFRKKIGSLLVIMAFCVGIGLGGWFSWDYLWPLMVIAIGINALLKSIKHK